MYKFLPILLFAFGLAVTTDDIYDDSWAVIIGINEYEHVDKLNYAVQDAEAIKKLLISNFNFSKEHIIMLTDKEATLDNIRTKLFEVATSVNERDRLLVYFAGHGETYNLKSGGERGYLIPVDGDLDNIFATCLPMSDIKEVTSVTVAKHVLFLIDACYGGLLAVDARSISKTTSGYIDKITRDNARQIITAGGKGEQVIEKSEWGHSAFAKNLLHGLKTGIADEDSDGYITADELGSFLKKRVTIDSDNFQTPVKRRFGSDEGEFVFINNVNIEKQIINISTDSGKENVNDLYIHSLLTDSTVHDLKHEIELLKSELNKPVMFIQGCTDETAINYNPEANLDDNLCILIGAYDAYLRFGVFNKSENTLEVYIRTGIGSGGINNIDFTMSGFIIQELFDGELIDNNYSYNINGTHINITSNETKFNANYNEKLLFRGKVQPIKDKFCLEEVRISGFNVYHDDCISNLKFNKHFKEYEESKLLTNEINFVSYDYETEEMIISINVADSVLFVEGYQFFIFDKDYVLLEKEISYFNNTRSGIQFAHPMYKGEHRSSFYLSLSDYKEQSRLCISEIKILDIDTNYVYIQEPCVEF